MLVNRQLPALYNGISQQPATLRLPSQAEEAINCYPSVVDGLRKRPPSEHIAVISGSNLSDAYLHTINRDASERYVVVLTNGDLKVYGLDGVEKTVTFPHGKAYLAAASPKQHFACVTVADYTFIVNKTVVVTMETIGSDSVTDPSSYWWLNRVARTGDGLASSLNYVVRSAIQQQYLANYSGGTYRGEKQNLQELPDDPINGDIYKISGTSDSNFSSYYVRRNGAVWDETVAPGLKNKVTSATMPHALVRKVDGTFEFGPFSWAPRRVGDEATNKNPSFVGRALRDVFFYKNRLGFAVDENVVLSRAGDFGNFFRLTVVDLLADEVIDLGASETKVTKLNHAVPFDDSMMLFSDQVQFRLNHGDILSPTSCSLDPTTQYNTLTTVRPLPLGSDVYFVSEAEGYASLREYYVRDNAANADAGNITAHVPRYVPAGVTRLAGSSTHDVLFVLTSGAPNKIFVYKFYWTSDNEKAQSAWFHWEFDAGDQIISADVLSDYLYLIVQRAAGAYLERIPLESGAKAPGLSFQVYLDRRTQVTGTYLPAESKTEFVLPHAPNQSTFRLVRGAAFSGAQGALMNATGAEWIGPATVRIPGNWSAGAMIAGANYTQRYTFSEVFMTNREGVPVVTGRLQLRTWTVYFIDTAYFKTEVAPYGVSPDIEEVIPSKLGEFDGKTLGQLDLTLGAPVFAKGAYSFSVWGDSTVAKASIVNDTPYGLTLQQAEWEGFYYNRARTI